MRQYHRFVRRTAEGSAEDADALRRFLEQAPGVTEVGPIKPHRKGGHCVVFELERESIDAFIVELDRNNWCSVF